MTARPEGCGVVPVASNQREMDSRIYSPAQCVGQLAENAAAKGSEFNATEFNIAIMSQFETSTRAHGTDVGLPSSTLALKVLDNGVGFLYEEVEDMLTYGTPDKITTPKKFGSVWHTLAAIGSNFDQDGYYNLRRLSWPETFVGSSLEDLQEHDFFGRGSPEAYHELFRQGGKTWATLKNLNIAHKYFKEIKGTGVLGIFPFGLKSNDIKADLRDDDIEMQGVSLSNLLSKYFLPQKLGLLPTGYWKDFRGFEIKLQVGRKKIKSIWPVVPPFPVSPAIPIIIGEAEHTVVYGPYQSDKPSGNFPYKQTAGSDFHNKKYRTYLTSRSRILNPLHPPKAFDRGGAKVAYFQKQRAASQKGAGTSMQQLLDTLCGLQLSHAETPEAYAELKQLLDKHQVFDSKNRHLDIDEYVKQLKNLKWLLGCPFEIYVKVDTDALEFNDAKDDLKDDALKRDSFFANVHATIALDVLKRMLPGFNKVIRDADQKAKAAAKAEAAEKAATAAKAKATTAASSAATAAAQAASAANGKTPAAARPTAVASSSRAPASTARKVAAATPKGTASTKRVPKTTAQPPKDTPSPTNTAELAVDLGRSLAQAASGPVSAPGTGANQTPGTPRAITEQVSGTAGKPAQQQSAVLTREQRYQARMAAHSPEPQPEQQQDQGEHQSDHEQQDMQGLNGQLTNLRSPTAQGKARASPRDSGSAGRDTTKRRKLSAGLMESLTIGNAGTSDDAQGLDMLAKAAAQGTASQATSLSQQTLSHQPNTHPDLMLDMDTVPDSNDLFQDADSAGLRVSRQEFEDLWHRAMARGDIQDTEWTQDLKAMALMWAPESL